MNLGQPINEREEAMVKLAEQKAGVITVAVVGAIMTVTAHSIADVIE